MRTFQDIETIRLRLGVSKREVYKRAKIHHRTWYRLEAGDHRPNMRTLEKLGAALDAIERERAAA